MPESSGWGTFYFGDLESFTTDGNKPGQQEEMSAEMLMAKALKVAESVMAEKDKKLSATVEDILGRMSVLY